MSDMNRIMPGSLDAIMADLSSYAMPCPFCGSAVGVSYNGAYDNITFLEAVNHATVKCSNDNCLMSRQYVTLHEWNKRLNESKTAIDDEVLWPAIEELLNSKQRQKLDQLMHEVGNAYDTLHRISGSYKFERRKALAMAAWLDEHGGDGYTQIIQERYPENAEELEE